MRTTRWLVSVAIIGIGSGCSGSPSSSGGSENDASADVASGSSSVDHGKGDASVSDSGRHHDSATASHTSQHETSAVDAASHGSSSHGSSSRADASRPKDAAKDHTTQPTCPCYDGDGVYCATGAAAYASQHDCTVTDLASNTGNLYTCSGGSWTPQSPPCANGCTVEPTGTNDICNKSSSDAGNPPPPQTCDTAGKAALAWEAQQISAGIAGNCTGAPPSCYSGWCEAFVYDAYAFGAGVTSSKIAGSCADEQPAVNNPESNSSYCAGQSAYDHMVAAGGLTALNITLPIGTTWTGPYPPCGAVVFWGGNTYNGGNGHITISDGNGNVSTSGWNGYAGSTSVSITWMSQEEDNWPVGWGMP